MKLFLFLILFLFNISLQYIFQLKSSKRITNISEIIQNSTYLQKLNITLPILNTCFGNPNQCFDMTLDTTHYNTFLQGDSNSFFEKSFNKSLSNTLKDINETFSFNYQEKNLESKIYLDNIKIEQFNSTNKLAFTLFEDKDESIRKIEIDGIIGLIRNSSSIKTTNNYTLSFIDFISNNSNFSIQINKKAHNELEGKFLINENYIDSYSKCNSSNLEINDNEWKCKINSIQFENNYPILFSYDISFQSNNPIFEFPKDIGIYMFRRIIEQSFGQCGMIDENNITLLFCNNTIDVSKFNKIYFHFNDESIPILINPINIFEIIEKIYLCKIIVSDIDHIIFGLPSFIDNKIIFDKSKNQILFLENKVTYFAFTLTIIIIAFTLIAIPFVIFIFEKNKKVKSFHKLDDIGKTKQFLD
jgi:hypothetical protein